MSDPDISEMKGLFEYDPDTGVICRKVPRGGFPAGPVAVNQNKNQYLKTSYKRSFIWLHRLAWALHTGSWPSQMVDHKNQIKSDNRWVNLRLANHTQNQCNRPQQKNNTSGIKGVNWHPVGKKWRAEVAYQGRRYYLGLFVDKDAAELAVKTKRSELHNSFTCHT